MKPRFFSTQAIFGAWLSKHFADPELWVGFYKTDAGKRGMTYFEAVDEALCWGWIDGIVRRVDEQSFMHRFTPRKGKSTWSNVNVAKAKALISAGRMQAPGLAAFEAREAGRTGIYAYEREEAVLPAAATARFKRSGKGWKWFAAQGASYRHRAIHWVVSAKRPETRERRLVQLIEHSTAGKRLRQFTPLDQRT